MGIRSIDSSAPARAVFLDRDGVLNRAVVRDGRPYPPDSVGSLEILADVPEALARLKNAGYLLIVVTNQPDVGRHTQSREAVEAIHSKLRAELPIDDVFVCYHTDGDSCNCRKPLPGLLHQAAKEYQLHLPSCYLVGDRWRDIDAGHNAGCSPILIDYNYDERRPQKKPSATLGSLSEAANWIIEDGANTH